MALSVLLLLQESPAGSRELREALVPLGFEQTTSQLERALDTMASIGLVCPIRDRTAEPRDARIYDLTADGRWWLRRGATDLRATESVLGGFLARFGERFVGP